MTIAQPHKLTAMYHAHVAGGAVLVDRDGWQLPARYNSVQAELDMVREAGGIYDISPAGKLDVQGAEALARLSDALSLSKPIQVGWVQPCSIKRTRGRSTGGMTVAGLSYDEALVLTPPADVASTATFLEGRLDGCAHLVDVTSSRASVGIVGPLSPRVLSKLVDLDLDTNVFTNNRCAQGRAAEVHVLVLRSDIAGISAYQLYVTRDFGEYIWDALLRAGRGDGVGPVGIETLEKLASGA